MKTPADGSPTPRAIIKSTRALAMVLALLAAQSSRAVTLQEALDRTLQNNPAITQAKLNLEQASGHRVVLNSITWPNIRATVPAGLQGGQRSGESTKAFIFARGLLTQPVLNVTIPPSRRLGDVDVLIAEQQLNVAVVEQLHAARLAFYSALYNRGLQSIREEERERSDQNATSQKQRYEAGLTDRSAFTSATVQASEFDSQIAAAGRACGEAQLQLGLAMGESGGPDSNPPDAEGRLESPPFDADVATETAAAIARRADIRLARLMVRAATQEQRIIEAGYFPAAAATLTGYFVPTAGIHAQGSTRHTDDLLGSEAREGGVYTWRVIDNGKVIGADLKQQRIREINEIACRKLEANVGLELMRIRNNIAEIKSRQQSLTGGATMAQQNAEAIQQNLGQGIMSELDYRQAQNASLDIQSGLLTADYQYNIAMAEWDRATGRYFQFSDETAAKKPAR